MDSRKRAPSGNGTLRQRANPVSGCPLTAGISQKVLTEQLRELITDQIVRREPKGAVPAPVEYSLTEYGQSVLPLVEMARTWGRGHIERVEKL